MAIRFGRSETWRNYNGRHTYVPVYDGNKQIGTIGANKVCMRMQYFFAPTDARGNPIKDGKSIKLSGDLNTAKRQFRDAPIKL